MASLVSADGEAAEQAAMDDGGIDIRSNRTSSTQKRNSELARRRRDNITNNPEDFTPHSEEQSNDEPPKSQETTAFLANALHDHFLFASLSETDLMEVISTMSSKSMDTGSMVIQQGDSGTEFFVLESGHCEIIVDGNKVGDYEPGCSFGELALIYNAPRAATILATTPISLWSINLGTFRRVLSTSTSSRMVQRCEFLKKIPIFETLSNEMITKIAGALHEVDIQDGQYIIRQGDVGEEFYIIHAGQVRCTQQKRSDSKEIPLLNLSAGDYFGEMALMLDEPRHANVIAVGPCKCLSLDRSDFDELLGPLQDVISAQMRIRILRSVPLLGRLSDRDLDRLARAMRVQQFEDEEYIIREGETGTRFYIINDGDAVIKKKDTEGVIGRLTNQDYFGEIALVKNEPRMADVIADGSVECLVLEQNDFQRMLGKLGDVILEEIKRREASVGSVVEEAAAVEISYEYEDLEHIRTLGTGTFGRVKLVQHGPTGNVFALKCMQKAQIVQAHQERNIMNEKNILLECKHPFILELYRTYMNQNQLFMLMEIVQGGELWTYIYEKVNLIRRTALGGFIESAAMFYAGCVISAFQYVHDKGVAYRDLKPENLLIDSAGYCKIIDFGFAKRIPYEKDGKVCAKSFTICGTPEYLSPELIQSSGHDKSVDYWALGCLVYELLVGSTPFQDDNQREIFRKITNSKKHLSFPKGMNPNAVDLIRRLLTPNPAFRLGNLSGAVDDIMDHPWFQDAQHAGFAWDKLNRKEIKPPYVPRIRDPLDTSNFDPYAEEDHVPRFTGSQAAFAAFV